MNYSIRHEGSPRSIDHLSVAQVLEGLRDGLWEPTDEVKGPQDPQWLALENHPQFADAAADYEPLPPPSHGDETRLDMNPLIDVALVLLIFFILTTTYETMRKVMDMPGATAEKQEGKLTEVSPELVKEVMIKVEARQENGQPVIRVEDEPVAEKDLRSALRRYVRETRKTRLLIDAKGVEWGVVVKIQDEARGAGVQNIHVLAEQARR
jgi:biopolymer transport protein ExbD